MSMPWEDFAPQAPANKNMPWEDFTQESPAVPKRFAEETPPTLTQDAIEYLKSTGQNIGNIYAGAAQGAADTAINLADIVHALPKKEQNLSSLIAPNQTSTAQDYKAAIESKLSGLGADTKSDPFGVGQVVGESIATLPIGGVLGKAVSGGAKLSGLAAEELAKLGVSGKAVDILSAAGKSKIPEQLATALKYGGTKNVVEGDFVKDLGYRTLGGATTQGVTGQVIAPENNMGVLDTGLGAGIGGATATLAPVGRFLGKVAEPVTKAGREAILNRKLESLAGGKDTMGGLIDRLRNKGMTPEQLAVAMDSPEIAASIRASEEKVDPSSWILKRDAEAEALASRVNQAQSSLNALHQGELPVSNVSANAPYQNVRDAQIAQKGALEDTKAARTAELLRQAETQQAGLEEAKQQVASTVAQPAQREIGQSIAARKVALEDEAKALVSPIYKQAYELAPEPFSVQPLIDKASQIADKISTAINKDTAPLTDKALTVFKQKAEEGPAILDARGNPMKKTSEGIPHAAKLEDLKELRSVVLKEARNLKGDPKAGLTIANLDLLRQGVEESIAKHAPTEARAVFNQANELYRTTVAEPFKEGAVSNLTRQTSNARPKISPSDVTERMLQPDRAADFIRAFGNDPEALQAIATGVEGKFNAEVVQGGKSADKFLKDNREALKTLDSTGAGIQNRLSEIVRNFEPIEANQTALGEQVKAIPKVVDESVANQQRIISKSAKDLSGATDAENLAKVAVNADARVMGRILHKMTPEAKPELAKQVISNAFEPITAGVDKAGTKVNAALENPRIATLLKSTYGKEEGAAKLADFKDTAHIQTMIEGIKKDTPKHPYDTAQALDNLTEGKPQVKRAVEDIMATINDNKKFNLLAERGLKAGEGTAKLATQSTPATPFSLTTWASVAKWVHSSLIKVADKSIAERLSKELMSSEAFANALERAQQGPSQTNSAWALQYGRILPRTAAGAVTSITGEK